MGKFIEVKFGKWANPNQLVSKIYIGEWAACIQCSYNWLYKEVFGG